MYPIALDRPIPTVKRNPVGHRQKYNFGDLTKIGASFEVPMSDFKSPDKAVDSLRSTLNAWKKRTGVKHSYQIAKTEAGVGVWLTAVAAE